jgi:hypothetical protein
MNGPGQLVPAVLTPIVDGRPKPIACEVQMPAQVFVYQRSGKCGVPDLHLRGVSEEDAVDIIKGMKSNATAELRIGAWSMPVLVVLFNHRQDGLTAVVKITGAVITRHGTADVHIDQ